MTAARLHALATVFVLASAACSAPPSDASARPDVLDARRRAEYDHAYAVGVQAVVYGWAPVMMDVARELQTSVDAPHDNGQAPLNRLGPITRLWDHRDRSYATPNNDTLYLQGWADLAEEPLVLFVPEIVDRYWIMQILDMYTESVVDLCTATVGTGGGYFAISMRGAAGSVPDGVPVFESSTRYVWLAGRLGVTGPEDVPAARDVQSRFRLMGLAGYPDGGEQPEPAQATGAPEVRFPEGVAWFDRLDAVLRANPLIADGPLTRQFEFIGVGVGGVEGLGEMRRSALEEAYRDGLAIVVDAAKYSDTPINGWNWEFDAGRYGTDYLQRAAVNMNSVGLNSPERAMYPKRYVDDRGDLFDGANAYTVTLPQPMPVRVKDGGFWSLTMYDDVDRFMVENPIGRYKIGSMTEGLVLDDDGSLTLHISHGEPGDPKARSNWLPAPDGAFMLQLRLYEPEGAVVQGEFVLPEVYRATD